MPNVAGAGVILGADYVVDKAAFIESNAERYALTPVFPVEGIPSGKYVHIGEGVWKKTCSEPGCDVFMLSYGSVAYFRVFAEHEASHGRDVPGFNVPLLGS
jgi:hypothetical protein